MWVNIASLIIRYRIAILVFLVIATGFMAYQAKDVAMSYKFGGLLPADDPSSIEYQDFIDRFSEDGNVLVVGINDPGIYELDKFKAWYKLGEGLKNISVPFDTLIDGKDLTIEVNAIDSVFSVARSYTIVRNEEEKKFAFEPIAKGLPREQFEVDSIWSKIHSLPFYEGVLYQDDSDATLMMVFVNAPLFNSPDRGPSINMILEQIDVFTESTGIETHISGLPFIRTQVTEKVKGELKFFILMAAAVTALLLFLFFRNIMVVLISMIVVSIGVVWSLGFMGLLGYEITMLMGLIPPLMIVIGVPNCIYLLNKYHSEFKKHGNKVLSLTRVIHKVGNATFLTNTTTALGFATFIFTSSDILIQFGIIASINIIGVFIISILTIPTLFSFLPEPKRKHVRHLDRRWLFVTVNELVKIVQNKRRWVYVVTVIVISSSIYGMTKVQTTGNIVSDLPSDDRILVDLKWFEENFSGVMPFEILVDTKKKGQITKTHNLKRIEKLQNLLAEYPEFSKSLSIVDASKFVRQAFYNGDPDRYTLIKKNEQSFIGPYLKGDYETKGLEYTFMDTAKSMTRVSTQVADIGTLEMDALMTDLRPRIDSIFNPEKYDLTITGVSVVFLKGTSYMVNNLFTSLLLAIILIAIIMAFLFRSLRMVLISLLPNMIPLLFTAGIMGFFGINLKPSTILVFSIALGISVDDTIHFLAKYRQELKVLHWNIKESVLLAVKETGVSMMYTSIVLFFGFGIFSWSVFDGTRALGILVSVTLLVAMFTNLLLLPSLLLSFEKYVTTKAFSEPYLEIIDEEEDIELEELQVMQKSESTSDVEEGVDG